MRKQTYLILLMVVWYGAWGLRPYGSLDGDVKFIVKVLTMLLGFFIYYTPTKWRILKSYRLKPFRWILAGVMLSMIPAYLFYDQSFIQSIITYRGQMLWFIIPLLMVVSPTEKDVVGAAKWITILMASVYFVRRAVPSLFAIDLDALEDSALEDMYVPGFSIATIPLFYNLMQLRNKFQWKTLFIIILCYAYIFIMQNRSTLFPVTLLIAFSFWGIRSRFRIPLIFLFSLTALFFVVQTGSTWISLYDETTSQLDNQDYNRNLAFQYYIFEANENWLTVILGHGLLSSHATSLMHDLMQLGIHASDLGFIGFWNEYGIIPIIVFVWSMIIPLIKREQYSWYLKLWAVHMLACSMTISYFGNYGHMIYFALYYYLFMLYYKRYDLQLSSSKTIILKT